MSEGLVDRPVRFRLLRRATLVLTTLFGIVLLAGWATTRLLSERAEAAHPPRGAFVEIEGLVQHYVERGAGDAPPVVLLHGAFGSSKDYELTVLESLAREYRCIAWDRPGHGYSERDFATVCGPEEQARLLLELIDALEIERPLVVGFSYGGAVALATALRAPDAIRGVVLLNGPSHPWPDPIELEYRLPDYPIVGPLVTSTLLSPVGHLLSGVSVSKVFDPEPVDARFDESPIGLALRPHSYRANAEDIRVLKPTLRAQAERYRNLAVPITMVVSEGDRIVSPTIHSLQLRDVAPRFSMLRIPDAGHQILYTRPRVVLDAIQRAMQEPPR